MEPLAALVSVAAICLAVSVYAGFASFTIAESGDGQVDRATLDSVWSALAEDGVIDGGTQAVDQLGPETLPRGHRVAVNVTIVGDDGRLDSAGAATFGTDARTSDLEPPPTADASGRAVPVRVGEGDIRPGRLTVVVWDG
ncbi:MAG: hypothetical protein J07HX64_02379 [halophilic archaeon J07HX64]|nr:MAG: hypothetical protein J07HX64_02379 [halophilic archaeon J07HX64]